MQTGGEVDENLQFTFSLSGKKVATEKKIRRLKDEWKNCHNIDDFDVLNSENYEEYLLCRRDERDYCYLENRILVYEIIQNGQR